MPNTTARGIDVGNKKVKKFLRGVEAVSTMARGAAIRAMVKGFHP